jgi:hypothetical protein
MPDSLYSDGEYLQHRPSWHEEDSAWKAEQIMKLIARHKLEPRTVCEVGCGAGEILNQLYGMMPPDVEFSGYDISPQAYDLCKQREKDRLKFYNEDLLKQENTFDLILAIDVIEHIEDCFSFMRKLRSMATYKIYNIPLELWVKSMFPNQLLNSRKTVGHLHYFNKELALELLKETGHEIVNYRLTPGYQLPNLYHPLGRVLKYPRMVFYKISEDLSTRMFGGNSLLVLTR